MSSKKFLEFSLGNKLNLHDNTVLIRLAIINLINHIPSNEEVKEFKIALMRPGEFDDWMQERLEELQK